MQKSAVSAYVVKLPIEFLVWWFLQAPAIVIKILQFTFYALVHLLSLKLALTTFFKPWKNEYRDGLVRTAIFIGAFIKTFFILFDLIIIYCLLVLEAVVLIAWFLLPFVVIFSLYGSIFS